MKENIFELYSCMPSFLQNVAVSVEGWRIHRRRFGDGFEGRMSETVGRLEGDEQDIHEFKKERLSAHLRAASESEFWRQRFQKYGVDPNGDDPSHELQKLPCLRKSEFKERPSKILPAGFDTNNLLDRRTSGTTGSGLQFWQTFGSRREQFAIWWRYRRWHGLDRDTWCGYFGGRRVVSVEQSQPPFWRYDIPGKQVIFSNYHIGPDTSEDYLETIRRWDLPWLHGYPSSISLLAQLMLERNLSAPESVRIITTGAENLLDSQRETIRKAFKCEVREHYGLAESVANISECEYGRLHVDEDFSGVEFVPVNSETDQYRIVGTNWSNPAFPLFRYDTGDIATLSDEEECPCGRLGRIVERIEGRREDYVVLPSGARIGRLDHIFKDMVSVRSAQIYQPSRSRVVLRIVEGEAYDEESEAKVLREARKRLGEEIDIDIEYRDQIPTTDSGKLKFVVSDIESMQLEEKTGIS